MKLDKKDTPKVIVLGALIAILVGWVAFSVTSGKPAPSRQRDKKEAVASEKAPVAVDERLSRDYVGRYVGRYEVDDQNSKKWQGKAALTVDAKGVIAGHVWLPTSDGGPGLVSVVSGQAKPNGELTLKSEKACAGTPDGRLVGTPVERFQFSHNGRLQKATAGVILMAAGKGSQGFAESISAKQTTEVAVARPVGGRDPFAPCLVPELFRKNAAACPTLPRMPQLGKLPSFSPSNNAALGIRPLPPVDVVEAEPDPKFVLTGVIVGPTNVAIIRAGDAERHIVKEGQFINGKYLIRSIDRDQVVLTEKGRRIYLKLGGSSNAS